MPSNEQRRQAAKRKLERQRERRAERARKRKQTLTIVSVVGVVVVVAAAIGIYLAVSGSSQPAAPPQAASACTYNLDGSPPSKPATAPDGDPPTTGTVNLTLRTSQGAVPLTLNRQEAPCAVNAVTSLAEQRFYDDTPCHRLTTGEGLKVLQCGDPTGQGTGGPGFEYDEEPPTGPNPYARGAVAMAKTSAPGTTGSQFFLVFADSQLPPEYTVIGQIAPPGLQVLDRVAAAGSDDSNGPGDGAPRTPVRIQQAAVSPATP